MIERKHFFLYSGVNVLVYIYDILRELKSELDYRNPYGAWIYSFKLFL